MASGPIEQCKCSDMPKSAEVSLLLENKVNLKQSTLKYFALEAVTQETTSSTFAACEGIVHFEWKCMLFQRKRQNICQGLWINDFLNAYALRRFY